MQAPARQPTLLVSKSRFEGTRLGRKFCTASMPPETSTPRMAASSAAQMPRTNGYRASTSSTPKGT